MAGFGVVRHGTARQGIDPIGWGEISRPVARTRRGAARPGAAGRGRARRGLARPGAARPGTVWLGKDPTGWGEIPLPVARTWRGGAWRSAAWHDLAGQGGVRRGKAWTPPTWSEIFSGRWSECGTAGPGVAGRGLAWRGRAGQGMDPTGRGEIFPDRWLEYSTPRSRTMNLTEKEVQTLQRLASFSELLFIDAMYKRLAEISIEQRSLQKSLEDFITAIINKQKKE